MPRLKWNTMTKCRLQEGPSNGVILDIAPTMKTITHNGEKYWRMDNAWWPMPSGGTAGVFLWSRWGDEKLKEIEARTQVAGTP